MADAYFSTSDGTWFRPTDHTRGPWDPDSCHAGPPAALAARSVERLVPDQRLSRLSLELLRPIPMRGFRVEAEVARSGRSATFSSVRILDDEKVYATGSSVHLRRLPGRLATTSPAEVPVFSASVPGSFPIRRTRHPLPAFPSSVEVRYDPSTPEGGGGPKTVWMRSLVPILPDEEPSGFQRICPLADCGNGISWNEYLDRVLFLNPDLVVTLHREPEGEWFCSRAVSHWQGDGTGMSDAELFDREGAVGRAVQTLLLQPVG